jgi:hypothetical protein
MNTTTVCTLEEIGICIFRNVHSRSGACGEGRKRCCDRLVCKGVQTSLRGGCLARAPQAVPHPTRHGRGGGGSSVGRCHRLRRSSLSYEPSSQHTSTVAGVETPPSSWFAKAGLYGCGGAAPFHPASKKPIPAGKLVAPKPNTSHISHVVWLLQQIQGLGMPGHILS